jgi:hypothetical protein
MIEPICLRAIPPFTIFLYQRMLGRAVEVDDHLHRGRGMDMCTSASQIRFVA